MQTNVKQLSTFPNINAEKQVLGRAKAIIREKSILNYPEKNVYLLKKSQ